MPLYVLAQQNSWLLTLAQQTNFLQLT